MTPQDFTAWRTRLAMTQAQAAAALGYSVRAVAYWEHGEWPLPLSVPLACKTIERNRQPRKPAPRQGPRMRTREEPPYIVLMASGKELDELAELTGLEPSRAKGEPDAVFRERVLARIAKLPNKKRRDRCCGEK